MRLHSVAVVPSISEYQLFLISWNVCLAALAHDKKQTFIGDLSNKKNLHREKHLNKISVKQLLYAS